LPPCCSPWQWCRRSSLRRAGAGGSGAAVCRTGLETACAVSEHRQEFAMISGDSVSVRARCPGRRRARLSRARSACAAAAAVALGALIAVGPPGQARASSSGGYDQITGVGLTKSAITVPWVRGVLDASNKPIAAANADRMSQQPTSPLAFMYPDFRTLKVTVSQTTNIVHQGVTITWTGGKPTINPHGGGLGGNFLQMMQCYGDSPSGP